MKAKRDDVQPALESDAQVRPSRSSSIGSEDTLVPGAEQDCSVPQQPIVTCKVTGVESSATSALEPISLDQHFVSSSAQTKWHLRTLSTNDTAHEANHLSRPPSRRDSLQALLSFLDHEKPQIAQAHETLARQQFSLDRLRVVMDEFEARLHRFRSMSDQLVVELQLQMDERDPMLDEMLLLSIRRATSQSLEAAIMVSWFRETRLSKVTPETNIEAKERSTTLSRSMAEVSSNAQPRLKQKNDQQVCLKAMPDIRGPSPHPDRRFEGVRPHTAQADGRNMNVCDAKLPRLARSASKRSAGVQPRLRSLSNAGIDPYGLAHGNVTAQSASSLVEPGCTIQDSTRFLFPHPSPAPPTVSSTTWSTTRIVRKPKLSLKSFLNTHIPPLVASASTDTIIAPSSHTESHNQSDASHQYLDDEWNVVLASLDYVPPSLAKRAEPAPEKGPTRIDMHLAKLTAWVDGIGRRRHQRRVA
ncbi:cytoskeleton assembly control protein [Pseudozyma hubeiensis SY62]|uniref:Cytoskeleton assembly control protein n=1 Tax=Pseudozyma hubeiensis (strain SY62) TaxID=1305764 RepID=R9P9K7_PSEHS|nr:cytoskeleton assembly control protein [Pseudozyma hubeiensis SY62]GAC94765.1 cytoskeleton assembly control protein [Pseudozyma hubeiensis SY62]